MRVIRPGAVVEGGVHRSQVCRIRIEPRVDVFRLDRDDAAVMPGGSDLRRWIVGDRRERQQIRFARALPDPERTLSLCF